MAAAALERSLNANVLRRWVVESERPQPMASSAALALPAPAPKEAFVALPLPPKVADEAPIKVEVRRGSLTVSVQWPSSAVTECAMWLREVLK
jgi:transposase